jgi:hypothetical protein
MQQPPLQQQRCAMLERATQHRPKARPPWRKRYGWYRLYDGFWRHPKWKVAVPLNQRGNR